MALGDKTRDRIRAKKEGMEELLQEEARYLQGYAQDHASWIDRSGEARKGIKGGVKKRRNGYTVYLAHTVWYGRLLETGTQAHYVEPDLKKALSWEGARHPYTGRIKHPGMAARPVLMPTIDANIDRLTRRILDYWSD